jgi:hypothetical protein
MTELTYQMVLSTLQTAGLLVGIFYYVTTMRNAQKTRELTLQSQELSRKAQEHALKTREAQLFMQFYSQHATDVWQNATRHIQNVVQWKDYDDFILTSP